MRRRRFQAIPLLPTPLIGRERELATARQALLSPRTRLLTLTGPPGVGKTSLAITVARSLLDQFAHGGLMVDLSPITDPAFVAGAIADALELRGGDGRPVERLTAFLRDLGLLLVLDNFEQVVDAAPLVAELLAACPYLRIVVTSREPLALRWEQELPVPPLAVPDLRRAPSPAAVASAPAVSLFVERARAVSPFFAPEGPAARLVGEICQRLDGLPLAIELAAVRTRALPLEAIHQQLAAPDDARAGHAASLDLLAGGVRDLPDRQQTLRRAITWSYTLLRPAEQTLLRRLAIFVGGCTFEAASAVCDATHETLGSLVEKSLLRQETPEDGAARLRLLEPIRHYAFEQLAASDELDAIGRRHADYFCALAEQAEAALLSAGQPAWLHRLDLDHDNLRAALRWTLEHQDAETAHRIAGALWRFWWVRGYLDEGARWLERVLAHADQASPAAHARALHAAGKLARERGAYDQAEALCRASLELLRALGDRAGTALALNSLANVVGDRGDYPAARALYEESLAIQRDLGDRAGIALALHNLAAIVRESGDLALAEALCHEALATYQAIGDSWGLAIGLVNLGQIAYRGRQLDRAEVLARESLRLRRQLGDRQGAVRCLELLADAAAASGQVEWAARLLGAVEAAREMLGFARPPDEAHRYEGDLAAARAQLGASRFQAAWDAGQALDLDDAVAEVLGDGGPALGAETRAGAAPAPTPPPRRAEPESGRPAPAGEPTQPRGPRPVDLLTPRERDIAIRLARGLTNRQIAHDLVITEGTAANYVRRVLQRLGFQNRAQVAAWAVEHGLHGPEDGAHRPASNRDRARG